MKERGGSEMLVTLRGGSVQLHIHSTTEQDQRQGTWALVRRKKVGGKNALKPDTRNYCTQLVSPAC